MLFCSGRLIIAAIGFCAASARSCVDCWARAAVLAVRASMSASPKVGQKAGRGISAFACRRARGLRTFPREDKGMQFAFADDLAKLPEREKWNQQDRNYNEHKKHSTRTASTDIGKAFGDCFPFE